MRTGTRILPLLLVLYFSLLSLCCESTESEAPSTAPNSEDNEDSCRICLENFEDDEESQTLMDYMSSKFGAQPQTDDATYKGPKVSMLHCKHKYHGDCISGWTIGKSRNDCPTCRVPVFSLTDQIRFFIRQTFSFLYQLLVHRTYRPGILGPAFSASYTLVKQIFLSIVSIALFSVSCFISITHLMRDAQFEGQFVVSNNNTILIDNFIANNAYILIAVSAFPSISLFKLLFSTLIYRGESFVLFIPKIFYILVMISAKFSTFLVVTHSFIYSWVHDREGRLNIYIFFGLYFWYYNNYREQLFLPHRFWAVVLEIFIIAIAVRALVFGSCSEHLLLDSSILCFLEIFIFFLGHLAQEHIYGGSRHCVLESIFYPGHYIVE